MRPQVLITNEIHPSGIDLLNAADITVVEGYDYSNDDVYFAISDIDAIIIRTETYIDDRMIKRGSKGRLKVIGRAGVGLDNIDIKTAKKYGIKVLNTPDANTQSAAEHTIGMMLALARHIPQATGGTRQGRWERHRFMGVELNGKNLAIIGVGRVGSRVAKIAEAIGMTTYGYDIVKNDCPYINHWCGTIDEVVLSADFVTIHTPYTPETEYIIDGCLMEHMKRGVRLINCARGPLVNQEDLIDFLDDGHIAGYACDVFQYEPVKTAEHPFYSRRNIICTPHLGAMTIEAQKRVSTEICTKVRDSL